MQHNTILLLLIFRQQKGTLILIPPFVKLPHVHALVAHVNEYAYLDGYTNQIFLSNLTLFLPKTSISSRNAYYTACLGVFTGL